MRSQLWQKVSRTLLVRLDTMIVALAMFLRSLNTRLSRLTVLKAFKIVLIHFLLTLHVVRSVPVPSGSRLDRSSMAVSFLRASGLPNASIGVVV